MSATPTTAPDARAAPEAADPEQGPDRAELLVARARDGDMQAWARLYHEHFDAVFRHLRYLTGDTAVAEDLTQETFAKALVALSTFRGRSSFSTWLHGVAINMARGHWRRERNTRTAHARYEPRARAFAERSASADSPDQATQQRRRAEALYEALATLPDTLREVFVLRDLEALSEREISERLGISRGNAAVRATRARARVRAELTRRGWLEGEP